MNQAGKYKNLANATASMKGEKNSSLSSAKKRKAIMDGMGGCKKKK